MSANKTDLKGIENLPIYGAYSIGGSVIGISNLVIFLAIAKYEALRTNKVYVIIMGLSFADFLNMSAFVTAGLRRTWLVFSGKHDDLYTPWQCAHTAHTFLWSFSMHMANTMLTVVSVDRLLCVMFPMRYIGWTYKYTMTITGVAYLYSIITGLIGLVGTYSTKDDPPSIPIRCITHQALGRLHPLYTSHYSDGPTVWAMLSVVIYLVVWVVHKRQSAQVSPQDQAQQRNLEHERKFTKSLALSCLCTFCLFIVPYQVAVMADRLKYKTLPLILWTASNLNPFANVVIYTKRHKEIRQAIKGMFLCKTMPTDITVWKANNMMAEMAKSAQNAANNNKEVGVNLQVEDL